MFVSLWSLKGGVGCSVIAALTALHRSQADDSAGTVLVDVAGDLPAVLGCAEPAAGLADWLRADSDGPPDGLARLAVDVAPGLQLVGRGSGAFPASEPSVLLARQLELLPGSVVVDAGLVTGSCPRAALARWFAGHATRSMLVTTACYLALVRAARAPALPSGVVVLREQGRALATPDIEQAVGAPVVAEVAHDIAVARAVDAGLLSARFPRGIHRALEAVA